MKIVQRTEIAVIGAGPAGIAAALAASRAGAAVTLVDEYSRPGGQIYRQPPEAFRVRRPDALGKSTGRPSISWGRWPDHRCRC